MIFGLSKKALVRSLKTIVIRAVPVGLHVLACKVLPRSAVSQKSAANLRVELSLLANSALQDQTPDRVFDPQIFPTERRVQPYRPISVLPGFQIPLHRLNATAVTLKPHLTS